MYVFRVSPDDLALTGARAAGDPAHLDEAKRAVALAGVRAVAGIGDTHGPLTAAVLDLVALHGQVLGVLAVGCAAMAGGLDRAAAAYRDVEAAVAASIGSGT